MHFLQSQTDINFSNIQNYLTWKVISRYRISQQEIEGVWSC